MYTQHLPETINVKCTDNGQVKEAYLSRFVENEYMDIVLNTVKLRLMHKRADLYVGSMAGYEFTANAPEITEIKPFRR
jgi:hypothetical protein